MSNLQSRTLRTCLTVALFCVCLFASQAVYAQTNGFTYQGKLGDAGAPANGSYDFQFKLFDQRTGGTQQGSTLTLSSPPVTVTNGGFTVQLDFGANFPGGDRYLETSVRVHSADPNAAYSTLSPRQRIGSTPYAIRSLSAATADSLSAACVLCITNAQIITVDGSKVTGTVASATNAGSATTATTAGNALNLGGVPANQYVLTGTLPGGSNFMFGDGSDGDVTITTATTLTRDMYYHNLTISDFMSLNPGGYRIFVSGTLTLGLERASLVTATTASLTQPWRLPPVR